MAPLTERHKPKQFEPAPKEYALFHDAAADAQAKQDEIAAIMSAAGAFVMNQADGARQDFNIIYHDHLFRTELKVEDKHKNGENVFVEVYQGDPQRPSGILVSEATVWIHTLGNECLLYRKTDMLLLVLDRLRIGEVPRDVGDNDNRGYTFNRRMMSIKTWCDLVSMEKLPGSKIWNY